MKSAIVGLALLGLANMGAELASARGVGSYPARQATVVDGSFNGDYNGGFIRNGRNNRTAVVDSANGEGNFIGVTQRGRRGSVRIGGSFNGFENYGSVRTYGRGSRADVYDSFNGEGNELDVRVRGSFQSRNSGNGVGNRVIVR